MMEVTPKKLKEELDKGTATTIVSVQTPDTYKHTHVPGAVNIPLESFEADHAAALKDKDQIIVVYGEYDENGRSQKAVGILEAAGYQKIGRLVGGLMGWQEAGYRTEGGMDS